MSSGYGRFLFFSLPFWCPDCLHLGWSATNMPITSFLFPPPPEFLSDHFLCPLQRPMRCNNPFFSLFSLEKPVSRSVNLPHDYLVDVADFFLLCVSSSPNSPHVREEFYTSLVFFSSPSFFSYILFYSSSFFLFSDLLAFYQRKQERVLLPLFSWPMEAHHTIFAFPTFSSPALLDNRYTGFTLFFPLADLFALGSHPVIGEDKKSTSLPLKFQRRFFTIFIGYGFFFLLDTGPQ